MNGRDIKRALKGYPVIVTGSDAIKLYKNTFCLTNTRPRSEKGKHWVVVYYPTVGPLEFFDSLSKSPVHYGPYFRRMRHYFKTKTRVQSYRSSNCGNLCVLYIKLRSAGYTLAEIEEWMKRLTLPL